MTEELLRRIIREELRSVTSDRLVGIGEACQILGVVRTTLYRYVGEGWIKPVSSVRPMKFRVGDLKGVEDMRYRRT
jgi:predicted site-specific integrase-resolvase